jgi:hypothetical protein
LEIHNTCSHIIRISWPISDGTCREGKKILDLGVHTLTGTLSLGFKSVAKENSETVAETIKETLKEFAKLELITVK